MLEKWRAWPDQADPVTYIDVTFTRIYSTVDRQESTPFSDWGCSRTQYTNFCVGGLPLEICPRYVSVFLSHSLSRASLRCVPFCTFVGFPMYCLPLEIRLEFVDMWTGFTYTRGKSFKMSVNWWRCLIALTWPSAVDRILKSSYLSLLSPPPPPAF